MPGATRPVVPGLSQRDAAGRVTAVHCQPDQGGRAPWIARPAASTGRVMRLLPSRMALRWRGWPRFREQPRY